MGTSILGSPNSQVIRILIVSLPKHQQRNANLQKGCSGGSSPIASPMIKLAKIWRRARREFAQLELPTFPLGGVFVLYSNFSLILGKIIL